MTNTEILLNLIRENPELPILPWVNYEVVAGGEYGYWLGSFGKPYVGEYAQYKCRGYDYDYRYFEDRNDFKENYYDFNEDELCEKFNYNPCIQEYFVKNGKYTQEQLEENKKNEKLMEEYLDEVADQYFKKAIIVYIDVPD